MVKAIIAMFRTTLPECDSASYRRIFKALLPFDKDEKKKVMNLSYLNYLWSHSPIFILYLFASSLSNKGLSFDFFFLWSR